MAEPTISKSERILILIPDRDSPPKRDYTGAFKPAAEALCRFYAEAGECLVKTVPVPTVDPLTLTLDSAEKQRSYEAAAKTCIETINGGKWTRIIFICHGWSTGIQLGFRISKQRGNDARNVTALINALCCKQTDLKAITLFACSVGDEPASSESSPGTGDNSFADLLRHQVRRCTVFAHRTVGHATRNPDLITFEASRVPIIGGVAWPIRDTAAYRNAAKLLTQQRQGGDEHASGDLPPKGGTRPAWASIPLCDNLYALQTLLSSEPAL